MVLSKAQGQLYFYPYKSVTKNEGIKEGGHTFILYKFLVYFCGKYLINITYPCHV
jgi:hypothetical protein